MKLVCLCLLSILTAPIFVRAAADQKIDESAVDNKGPVQLKLASWLGGAGKDRATGVGIQSDQSICIAGNCAGLSLPGPASFQCCSDSAPKPSSGKPSKNDPSPDTFGFVLKMSADGFKPQSSVRLGLNVTTRGMRVDANDNVWLLVESPGPVTWANGVSSTGTCLLCLNKELKHVANLVPFPDTQDFDLDSNGDILMLANGKLIRAGADGKEKWVATWKAHGGNRPGGIAVCEKTGNACVIGYGMTHTGKEPYKDPYAYGFDREGKEIWKLWNPDPKKEKASQFSTPEMKCNGLMADTTGKRVAAANGKFYLMLFADGGNSVCTHDPLDVDANLDPAVHEGVFQKSAGHGFKGASKTSVIFQADPATGKLEKGTWMCAWLNKQRANGLAINDATSDGNLTFVAGSSASGCPFQKPWFGVPEGELARGGFLAAFTPDFKMVQCGTFAGADIDYVACRKGLVAVAGSIRWSADPKAPDAVPPVVSPIQTAFGGESDAFFAIFQLDPSRLSK